MKLKSSIVNLNFKTTNTILLHCKPSVGDFMPINYINEEVKKVLIVTPLLIKDAPNLEGYDLLIYTE